MIDGAGIRVEGKKIRIDSDASLCSGEGRPERQDGARRWLRFTCTYTIVGPGLLDRDIEFRVNVLGRRAFGIVDAHRIEIGR